MQNTTETHLEAVLRKEMVMPIVVGGPAGEVNAGEGRGSGGAE
jgi:hypothetical protein